MLHRHCAIWLLATVLGCGAVAAQDGYVIRGDQIITEGEDAWRQWVFPVGTIDFDAQGVRPHFVARDINASLDAHRFPLGAADDEEKGGVHAAGSNASTAANILDGDPSTYWQPNLDDPQDRWWAVIDLGRMVPATRIVLRFAEEGQGDPFYHFRVLAANGDARLGASDNLDYHLVGRTRRPNLDQREFTFELSPFSPADASFTGDAVRFIQVVMTDSRLGKAEEVANLEAYQSLSASEQGDVEYFGRSRSGREWGLDEETYQLLDPSEQGSIRYYRREQPRLAELEVRTVGENIALGLLPRGGTIEADGSNLGKSVDGDYATYYNFQGGYTAEASNRERRTVFDLGSLYWIDRIQILTAHPPNPSGRLRSYRAKVSDGSLAPDGTLAWTQVAHRPEKSQHRWQELHFELIKGRFLIFDYLIHLGGSQSSMGEFMVFGEGYQPEVVLESPLIDLGNSRNLTTLHWQGQTPPGTRIEVATRTGDKIKTITHYFRKDGTEISEKKYNKTIAALRGPTTEEVVVDEENWSSWSQPHTAAGEEVTSPSPRRFMKVQVKLFSDHPDRFAQLEQLDVRFAQPWVDRAWGEVYPVHVERLGEETPLTFFVRSEQSSTDPGIDEVLLINSNQVPLTLRGIRLGPRAEVAEGGGQSVDLSTVEVRQTGDDSLWVQLPEVVPRNEVMALEVSTTLFGHGVSFTGRVGNRENSGAWQRVEAGDVLEEVESQVLRVLAPEGRIGLSGLQLTSQVVTPNGDGVNEAATLHFEVLRMDGAQSVLVSVYDLSGRQVWEFEEERARASGLYEIAWPGVDRAGTPVPPGVYLLRVEVDADAEVDVEAALVRAVYVAY